MLTRFPADNVMEAVQNAQVQRKLIVQSV